MDTQLVQFVKYGRQLTIRFTELSSLNSSLLSHVCLNPAV
jgi:hypothetical protein